MEQFAFGHMGMTPHTFNAMTLREYGNAVTGYNAKRKEEFEVSWEQHRMVSYFAALPHLKKGAKPTDLIMFPWEETKPTEFEGLTEEEKEWIKNATKDL